MVLPKEIRVKAGIRAGDKLAVASCWNGNQICCLVLIKAAQLASVVSDLVGPALNKE